MATQKKCALIPARGGSKRIPRKNVIDYLDEPMVLYTIKAAKESGVFDEVFVSTEDQEIKAICEPHCTVLDRDPALASDAATLKDVCLDFVQKHPEFEIICLLEADCPLRDAQDVKDSWEAFHKSEASMLMSVFRYGTFYPFWALANKDENGELKRGYQFFFSRKYLTKSQQLPDVYCPSGAFKWIRVPQFSETKTLYPDDLDIYVLDWFKAIDIDTPEELITAKMIKDFLAKDPQFFNRERQIFNK